MTTYYIAEFAGGRPKVRCTENRTYVACVIAPSQLGNDRFVTWCGTYQRGSREFQRLTLAGRYAVRADAREISAVEYREIKAAQLEARRKAVAP